MSQHSSFLQECSKSCSRCGVCKATRQLHLRDGFIHIHGSRNNHCPGSNEPPIATVSSAPQPLPEDFLRLADASSVEPAARHPISRELNTSSSLNHPSLLGTFIKHTTKSARQHCASHLSSVLDNIVFNPNELLAWSRLLNFGNTLLLVPPRYGKKKDPL